MWFLSMGTWQKNKFHQLIFVNCFEIHWWKETWTENKKCQLLKFVCWIFHLWIYIYRISSHLLNYRLPILFLFFPHFLCTDGGLVIFLFTQSFANTKKGQVISVGITGTLNLSLLHPLSLTKHSLTHYSRHLRPLSSLISI